MFKFYKVGGCVRDRLMGIESKDIDYTVVYNNEYPYSAEDIFYLLEKYLIEKGYHIWLSTPDCYTIRAKFPEDHINKGITADFVLARKEIGYVPGSRRPIVMLGTLHDDLERRDFTANAIAEDEEGNLVDPFDGQWAIRNKVLHTPLPIKQTFDDDPLRILRALRFHITKDFSFTVEMLNVLYHYDYEHKMSVVSTERIREELLKMFKHDTLGTLNELNKFWTLSQYIFNKTDLWLCPTTKQ